jgi:hypothetical protein
MEAPPKSNGERDNLGAAAPTRQPHRLVGDELVA